jgi:hypothetical protein
MIVEKIVYGYIVQRFKEDGEFIEQNNFVADGDVALEDEDGNPLDDLDLYKYYHTFDVK